MADLAAARRLHSGNRVRLPPHQFPVQPARTPTPRDHQGGHPELHGRGADRLVDGGRVRQQGPRPLRRRRGTGDCRRRPRGGQPSTGTACRCCCANIWRPGPGRGRFAFFPCAAYIGFGLAAGTMVKRAAGALGTADAMVGAGRLRAGLLAPSTSPISRIRSTPNRVSGSTAPR